MNIAQKIDSQELERDLDTLHEKLYDLGEKMVRTRKGGTRWAGETALTLASELEHLIREFQRYEKKHLPS